eukprot:1642235-Rhodomonas_salina.1
MNHIYGNSRKVSSRVFTKTNTPASQYNIISLTVCGPGLSQLSDSESTGVDQPYAEIKCRNRMRNPTFAVPVAPRIGPSPRIVRYQEDWTLEWLDLFDVVIVRP